MFCICVVVLLDFGYFVFVIFVLCFCFCFVFIVFVFLYFRTLFFPIGFLRVAARLRLEDYDGFLCCVLFLVFVLCGILSRDIEFCCGLLCLCLCTFYILSLFIPIRLLYVVRPPCWSDHHRTLGYD